MRFRHSGKIFLTVAVFSLSSTLWGQGARRQNAAAQTATPQGAAPQGSQTPAPSPNQTTAAQSPARTAGRGAGGGQGAPASSEFFDFDPGASFVRSDIKADSAPVETHQKISVNGQTIAYTTRAGFLPVRNATSGSVSAYLFYTSYSKDGVSDLSSRPLMFFFGGGPGVSPAWQEFGGFGPKRMKSGGGVAENPDTVLNQADLVFVNPVGTGFSFATQPNSASKFWTTAGDTGSLAEFVRVYLNRNDRLASPLFLAGEDPATGRVAGLTQFLSDHLIAVRGVVLLSMSASADSIAGDTQFITLLPSLILTSWHYKKLTPELNGMGLEQIVGQARQFASRAYLHALYKGDRITSEERNKVISDMARLTGLSKAFIVSNNLRISLERYNSELMRDQHLGFSRSDARVTGFTPMAAGGRGGGGRGFAPAPSVDFNLSALTGPFAGAYEDYLRRELNFKGVTEGIFYLNGGGIGAYTSAGSDDSSLSAAFVRNPNLQLFVGVNYFDLGLPFYAAEYTLAHLDVSPEVRAHNVTVSSQEAGQMAYLDPKALTKLERDLGGFISRVTETK